MLTGPHADDPQEHVLPMGSKTLDPRSRSDLPAIDVTPHGVNLDCFFSFAELSFASSSLSKAC
jgi:hypothetical protein